MSAAITFPHLRRRTALTAAAATLAAFAAAPQAASAHHCYHATRDPNAISIRKVQKATLCLLNRQRRAHHIARLRENGRLDLASVRHAQDMARRNYFDHGDYVGRIKSTDYLSGASSWMVGENIAWGSGSYATPKSIVSMWMHSPPHRHNILDPRFHEIGIGIARGAPVGGASDGATYATDFGARG
jgi:uncharacterized protein YkwD